LKSDGLRRLNYKIENASCHSIAAFTFHIVRVTVVRIARTIDVQRISVMSYRNRDK